jgi:hypothetical protein
MQPAQELVDQVEFPAAVEAEVAPTVQYPRTAAPELVVNFVFGESCNARSRH